MGIEPAIVLLLLVIVVHAKLTHIAIRAIQYSSRVDKVLKKNGLLGVADLQHAQDTHVCIRCGKDHHK